MPPDKRRNARLWISGTFLCFGIIECAITYSRARQYGDTIPGPWGGPMSPIQGYVVGGLGLVMSILAFYILKDRQE